MKAYLVRVDQGSIKALLSCKFVPRRCRSHKYFFSAGKDKRITKRDADSIKALLRLYEGSIKALLRLY
jgi:hypothetical protein